LIGDSTKAKNILGWENKIQFAELVERMVDYDCPIQFKSGCIVELTSP
jgi:GDP-D-mannose dehydratase